MQHKPIVVRSLTLALGMAAGLSGIGSANAEELPLYLALSQSLTRDSNLLRDNSKRSSDTISTTTVAAGLNKAYGRQNYRLSASASRNAYSENSQFDNDGYAVSAEVASEVGSNFKVTLNAGASQFLPSFEDQFNRDERNTERNRQASVDVRYGLYGRWSVNAGASYSKVDYQITESENKTSNSVFAGVRYLPSDLAYIGLTLYRTDTNLPNRVLVGGVVGEDIERTSVSLDTVWQVTGFSRLSGRLGMTSEKHPQDRRRDFDGLTGSASWNFTPAGKVSYALSWVRDTNNEGGGTVDSIFGRLYAANKRLTNSLAATATYQATAKIKFNVGYTHAQYEEDSGLESAAVGGQISSDEQTGRYNAVSLGVSYQPIRSVGLGCDLQRYDRTQSVFSRAYDGNTVACRASFTID
ncbi:hypothetical protein [Aquabacterium sp.]|uniref:hypothetical protein n=1 Tax=Aquabacterium sp. TaxID=1872578 RepID=UPI002634C458|nr:hypothetical protein [Aquabacterium sp.]MDD2976359.1 hypothetical protein [Aquabacterium sp.]